MKILVVRIDNIGDLICTTPIFSALRKKFPDSIIDALVNTYNSPVIEHNPYINNIYKYKKTTHSKNFLQKIKSAILKLQIILKIRQEKYDYAIIASSGFTKKALKLISYCKINQIIGYPKLGDKDSLNKLITLPIEKPEIHQHEVEATFKLLTHFDIHAKPGKVEIFLSPHTNKQLYKNLPKNFEKYLNNKKFIGLQISARKPYNRLNADNWFDIAKDLYTKYSLPFLIFWSPGSKKNIQHPGDDEKTNVIALKLKQGNIPFHCYETKNLYDLFTGINICQTIITSHGGAMHVAAALNIPIVTFFKEDEIDHWRPWNDHHKIVSHNNIANDISIKSVTELFHQLLLDCKENAE